MSTTAALVVADSTTRDLGALRDRKYDLILGRGGLSLDALSSADLDIHPLFDDRLVIVAGERSRWAGSRRKLDLADLVAEPWILQAPQTGNYRILAQGLAACGLAVPQAHLVTTSMSVITHFLADGPFLTAIPWSVAHYASLKILAVDVPAPPWPVNIVTLKHRIIGPTTAAFIACARDFTKPLRERSRGLPDVVGSDIDRRAHGTASRRSDGGPGQQTHDRRRMGRRAARAAGQCHPPRPQSVAGGLRRRLPYPDRHAERLGAGPQGAGCGGRDRKHPTGDPVFLRYP